MHRIIYTSEATRPMPPEELEGLIGTARRRNDADGLTGLLLYYPQSALRPAGFVQVLEGAREPLESTYERISDDPRHRNVSLLTSRPVSARAFGTWSMGLEHLNRGDVAAVLPGFSSGDPDAVRISDLLEDPTVAETLLMLYVA